MHERLLQGISHPNVDAQAVCVMHRKVAEQLWTALQPGREPRVFRRGGSTECRVPGAASLTVCASIVRWPTASPGAKQAGPTRQALLLRPQYNQIH